MVFKIMVLIVVTSDLALQKPFNDVTISFTSLTNDSNFRKISYSYRKHARLPDIGAIFRTEN